MTTQTYITITEKLGDYDTIRDQKGKGVIKPKDCHRCKFYMEEHGAYYCGSGFAQSDPQSKIKEHRNSHKFCLSFLQNSNDPI